MKTLIGCSSFNEAHWKGVFYPEDLARKDWFGFYCQHFNTYEMNASFYKFPTAKTLQGWYQKSPEGFLFSVKMYKGVTHFKKFNDCKRLISEFYEVCSENLKEKLACVLFQTPASFTFSDERLAMVLDSLDYRFANVFEFRSQSWWRPEVFVALQSRGVVFCNVSYPGLPEDLVHTSSAGYIRFHGVPKLFYSGYGPAQIAYWKQKIQGANWDKVFVYFNNTASEHGVLDALELKRLLGQESPKIFVP